MNSAIRRPTPYPTLTGLLKRKNFMQISHQKWRTNRHLNPQELEDDSLGAPEYFFCESVFLLS